MLKLSFTKDKKTNLFIALAITFDTLAYAKKLIAVGVPTAQAETIAEIINDQVATKQDILNTEAKLEAKVHESKSEIIKGVAGMLVAQAAVIATLVKLF